jgi:hypothetical protein
MNFSDDVSPLLATTQVSEKMQRWSEAIAKGEAADGDIYGKPSETQLRELENVRSLSRELQDNLHVSMFNSEPVVYNEPDYRTG